MGLGIQLGYARQREDYLPWAGQQEIPAHCLEGWAPISLNLKVMNCFLFFSGIFHWIFLNHSWLWITETVESKAADKGGATVVVTTVLRFYC